ncbi:MAG: substrate-binding domain-containing protein, partial [Kiritimatiellae bacterium]|nr:substrate-binding domain-containing protein [Kiritimatiellia bacterium]
MQNAPRSILYVGYDLHFALLRRRRLAGIRRFTKARGWDVATLRPAEATPEAVREAIARFHAVGCVVECWMAQYDLPPRLFGSLPVVYFNPPERRAWRGARRVECDEAAVARAAFRELSSGLPPCYAVAAKNPTRRAPWARERVAAFRVCCRQAGKPCRVFPERGGEGESQRLARLERWAAALPLHCAVFAVNDSSAQIVAAAMADAGRSLPRSATLVGAD